MKCLATGTQPGGGRTKIQSQLFQMPKSVGQPIYTTFYPVPWGSVRNPGVLSDPSLRVFLSWASISPSVNVGEVQLQEPQNCLSLLPCSPTLHLLNVRPDLDMFCDLAPPPTAA